VRDAELHGGPPGVTLEEAVDDVDGERQLKAQNQ
jgi:hypothetical protein